MITQIDKYIESKKLAWAPSTLKSERARLMGINGYLTGCPDYLWAHLEATQKPYARVTAWTRVIQFWDFLVKQGIKEKNLYLEFRQVNARLFKNTYVRCPAKHAIEHYRHAIERIANEPIRDAARLILQGALRAHELNHLEKDGTVIGKGGKRRAVFGPDCSFPANEVSYWSLYSELKKVGLTPHMLRKAALTELARQGINVIDMCHFAGWSSPTTAMSYIGATQQEKIFDLLKGVK